MRSSQNPPILPKLYPPLTIYERPSQNPPLPPKIISPLHFKHLYATLLESTLPHSLYPPFKLIMRSSQNLPLPLRVYPFLDIYMGLSQNLPSPPIFHYYMRLSQNLPLPPRIYQPFQQLCVALPESAPSGEEGVYSGREGYILGVSHIDV